MGGGFNRFENVKRFFLREIGDSVKKETNYINYHDSVSSSVSKYGDVLLILKAELFIEKERKKKKNTNLRGYNNIQTQAKSCF